MLAFFLIFGFLILAVLMIAVPWLFACIPYALMLLVTLILWTIVDGIHNLIPGHSGLSFLCAAVVAMILTAVLTRILPRLIKVALVLAICSVFMYCALAAVYYEIKPDSTQYCAFLTVGYTVGLIANIVAVILKGGESDEEFLRIAEIRNLFVSIIFGILNAVTVVTYILAVRQIWAEFWYGGYEGAMGREHIYVENFMADICSGYFATQRGATIYYAGLAIVAVMTVIASVVFDRKLLSKRI